MKKNIHIKIKPNLVLFQYNGLTYLLKNNNVYRQSTYQRLHLIWLTLLSKFVRENIN